MRVIENEKLAEIRERTDLVALVAEYVSLKKSGSSFKGLCPFHSEKTPSFYVHPDRGFFHCFGCQASGDAIAFLMQLEGVPFREAVTHLAERAGVELRELDSAEQIAQRQARAYKERLLGALEAAAGYYIKLLDEHEHASLAQAELARREIDRATASDFRLGYAPPEWDALARHLQKQGFSASEAEKVGLIVPRRSGKGHYDRFRHRLMFPISDPHGRIVAFSGRALGPVPGRNEEGEPPAKYINSPEGPLYRKSELLFGLHEARVALRREETALLCEGNFDVVGLAQKGFKNALAPLGTAFTPQQAALLRRYANRAVLLFDADEAGHKAVGAAQPLLAEASIAARVAVLPTGEDPDSFLRSAGPERMKARIGAAAPIVEYLIDRAAAASAGDPEATARSIESLGPILMSQGPVEARLYAERVARAFEVSDFQAVRAQLRRGVQKSRERGGSQRHRTKVSGEPNPQPRTQAAPEKSWRKIETDVVGAFLDHPVLTSSGLAKKVQEVLTSADLRAILALATRYAPTRAVDASAILTEVGDSPASDWLKRRLAIQQFATKAEAESYLERALVKLMQDSARREIRRLRREVLEARRAGDEERIGELMRELTTRFQRDASRSVLDREGSVPDHELPDREHSGHGLSGTESA